MDIVAMAERDPAAVSSAEICRLGPALSRMP